MLFPTEIWEMILDWKSMTVAINAKSELDELEHSQRESFIFSNTLEQEAATLGAIVGAVATEHREAMFSGFGFLKRLNQPINLMHNLHPNHGAQFYDEFVNDCETRYAGKTNAAVVKDILYLIDYRFDLVKSYMAKQAQKPRKNTYYLMGYTAKNRKADK